MSNASASTSGRTAPVDRLVRPFVRFMHVESSSGLVLMACTLLALWLVNSEWAASFAAIWQTPVGLRVGGFELTETLGHWINDGLMALFFFVVGLEIKREWALGELRDPRKAALPAFAALGGMLVPAAIYLAIQWRRPGESGWGIPMATDIAFVVGFLALLGGRVPLGLKILLLTLAIVDDVGAVLVIAIFYTGDISFLALAFAAAGFLVIVFFNLLGVRQVSIYAAIGLLIWLAFLKSGVHPTVAGVLLGLLTPASAWQRERSLSEVLSEATERLGTRWSGNAAGNLRLVRSMARETVSPLDRLESALHPWVAFAIMPLFALANAGMRLEQEALRSPVAHAVAIGLVVGKPVGIVLFSWIAVRLGLARLPSGVSWRTMLGAGCLAGIGFTMSLFIANLALTDDMLTAGKLGTLLGSSISAVLGLLLLLLFLDKPSPTQAKVDEETEDSLHVLDQDGQIVRL